MSEIDLMVIKIYLKVNRVMSEMFVQEIVHFFFLFTIFYNICLNLPNCTT